jgi:NitT/TauT family transport system substrate-binding protein
MKRFWRSSVLALAIALSTHPAAAQDKPEVSKLRLAVGGKSAIFYLPLSVTERLGYFKDAGLEVEIADVQSGARALQSLVGGSAEIGIGTFDHTIQMQAKSQPVARSRNTAAIPASCSGPLRRSPSTMSGRRA